MFAWLKQLVASVTDPSRAQGASNPQHEARYRVTVDEDRVVCRRPDGEEDTVTWNDLEVVIVETNDSGPWGADVWWVLLGKDGSTGCAVPQGATGEDALLEALQALPGFDNEQLIQAMSCVQNRQFLCWRRA